MEYLVKFQLKNALSNKQFLKNALSNKQFLKKRSE